MKSMILFTWALAFISFAAPVDVYAGGGCSGGGGQRGAAEGESALMKKHRLSKDYETAKKIFEGRIPLRPHVSVIANQQKQALSEIRGRIPETSTDLKRSDELMGRLSREQFEAVKYYLSTRYPPNTRPAEEIRLERWQREMAVMEK